MRDSAVCWIAEHAGNQNEIKIRSRPRGPIAVIPDRSNRAREAQMAARQRDGPARSDREIA
jgi:hypothetical protein